MYCLIEIPVWVRGTTNRPTAPSCLS